MLLSHSEDLIMLRRLFRVLISHAVLLIAVTLNAEVPFSPDQSFGTVIPEVGAVKSLRLAIADRTPTSGSLPIKISGVVTEVCQARGCWMILVDGDTHARIFFEDYKFFVPIQTSMQRAIWHGTLSEHVLSSQEAEHYAEDAGKQGSFAQKDLIKEYTIVAKGVQIENKM